MFQLNGPTLAKNALVLPAMRSASVAVFVVCGIWLAGLGLYVVFLRPPLLPHDPRFTGSSLAQIQAALPGLALWLRRVFVVTGGFMLAAGVLTACCALTAGAARWKGSAAILVVTGAATLATMSAVNFAIDADFKWLLLAPAWLWLGGLVASALERRSA